MASSIRKRVNILVVDDRDENLLALEAVLSDPSYRLVRAKSGREALKEVLDQDFALILLDVVMPGVDGYETATLIRERPRSRQTPIIFLTANDFGVNYVFRGYTVGAVDYLVKPVRGDRLGAAIAKARRWNGEDARRLGSALGTRSRRTHLCARVRGSLVLVPVGEIRYLLAEDKYVVVHHARGEVLVEESLKALEDEFGEDFVRIHRNCLVARSKLAGLVRSPDGRVLASVDGEAVSLEVSRRNLPALRKLVRTL